MTLVCSVQSCKRPSRTRGWCTLHYKRWWRIGDPLATHHIVGNDVARFWSYINLTDSCWLWTGCLQPRGYGQFSIQPRRTVRAHRWSYEHFVGPIPESFELDHLCRTRACVRPDHLEVVSHAENVRRGDAGKHWAIKTRCPRGHEYTEENTRVYRGKRHCRACDREPHRRSSYRRHHKITRSYALADRHPSAQSRLGVRQRRTAAPYSRPR